MKITKISISISNLCSNCKYRDTKKCIYDKLKIFEVCGKYKKKRSLKMSKIVKTIDGHQGDLLYIKDNTAFIKESNGEVWYCPKTDIIDEVNERDLFLDTIKEIVETNNWDENKDKKIEHLQSQLDHQKVMWNELKEWLEEKKIRNERRIKEAPINTEFYIRVSVQDITINKILTIMQELEGEDE